MKIKRVIRFEENLVKEKIKQESPTKPKKDISSNNEILVEEYHEDLEQDDQEIQENFSYNASNELRRCVERVISGRASTNMIGVFGMNSDVVINNFCRNLREMRENIIFVGQVEYCTALSDVYNSIAAIFLNYINNNYVRQYDMDYYMREVMLTLEKVYDNPQSYYEYASPLESLSNINRRYERDRNLLSAINRIKQIINSSSYSRSREPKFLVTVEMEKLDYRALSSLVKLNSSDIVIIVFSMFDLDLAKMSLSSSIGGGIDCMDKFFYPGNYVIARADTR